MPYTDLCLSPYPLHLSFGRPPCPFQHHPSLSCDLFLCLCPYLFLYLSRDFFLSLSLSRSRSLENNTIIFKPYKDEITSAKIGLLTSLFLSPFLSLFLSRDRDLCCETFPPLLQRRRRRTGDRTRSWLGVCMCLWFVGCVWCLCGMRKALK